MSHITKKILEHLADLARMEIIKYGLKYNSILILLDYLPIGR